MSYRNILVVLAIPFIIDLHDIAGFKNYTYVAELCQARPVRPGIDDRLRGLRTTKFAPLVASCLKV